MNERFTDSAGITCEYTPIEDLEAGDVVIIGWRTTVKRVEVDESRNRARVIWEWSPSPTGESVDQWNTLGTKLPREVTS
jgi:hypothetical protein